MLASDEDKQRQAATLTGALHVLHAVKQNVPDSLAATLADLVAGCCRVDGIFHTCDGDSCGLAALLLDEWYCRWKPKPHAVTAQLRDTWLVTVSSIASPGSTLPWTVHFNI